VVAVGGREKRRMDPALKAERTLLDGVFLEEKTLPPSTRTSGGIRALKAGRSLVREFRVF